MNEWINKLQFVQIAKIQTPEIDKLFWITIEEPTLNLKHLCVTFVFRFCCVVVWPDFKRISYYLYLYVYI